MRDHIDFVWESTQHPSKEVWELDRDEIDELINRRMDAESAAYAAHESSASEYDTACAAQRALPDKPEAGWIDDAYPELAKGLMLKPSPDGECDDYDEDDEEPAPSATPRAVTLTIGRQPGVRGLRQPPGSCLGPKWLDLEGATTRAVMGDDEGIAYAAKLDSGIAMAADAHAVWPALVREGWVGGSSQDCLTLAPGWAPREALRTGAGLDKTQCHCRNCFRRNFTIAGSMGEYGSDDEHDDPDCLKRKRVDLASKPALELPGDRGRRFRFGSTFPAILRFASSKGRFQRVAVGRSAGGVCVRVISGQNAQVLYSSASPSTAHGAFAAADEWLANVYYANSKKGAGAKRKRAVTCT